MVILKSKQVHWLKVVGVGGGGGNAVNHMVANMVQQEFMVISWAKVQLIAKNTVKSYSMRWIPMLKHYAKAKFNKLYKSVEQQRKVLVQGLTQM